MISANGVEYKNLPEQVQYLTEKAAEFAVDLDRVSASVESVAGDVAALQTSYTTLAEDVRIDKVNITNIKNGTTHLFETITDRHGNLRFVEGDITMQTIEGVTQTYGKWSLSGSHLMIVIAGDIADRTALSQGTILCNVTLPAYIKDKINTIYANVIERKAVPFYGYDSSYQSVNIGLAKNADGVFIRTTTSAHTMTANRTFRIQFDLLIDDE